MKGYIKGLIVYLLGCSSSAFSCSLIIPPIFETDTQSDLNNDAAGATPPPPIVLDVGVARGESETSIFCDGIGSISVKLEIPSSAGYEISELGFLLETDRSTPLDGFLSDGFAYHAFNLRNDSSYTGSIIFSWPDGHPREQESFDFEVTIRSISKNGSQSQPVSFQVKAPIGEAEE